MSREGNQLGGHETNLLIGWDGRKAGTAPSRGGRRGGIGSSPYYKCTARIGERTRKAELTRTSRRRAGRASAITEGREPASVEGLDLDVPRLAQTQVRGFGEDAEILERSATRQIVPEFIDRPEMFLGTAARRPAPNSAAADPGESLGFAHFKGPVLEHDSRRCFVHNLDGNQGKRGFVSWRTRSTVTSDRR